MDIWKKALVTVPAIVIVGSLMGIVSNSGFENGWYAALEKPAFQTFPQFQKFVNLLNRMPLEFPKAKYPFHHEIPYNEFLPHP